MSPSHASRRRRTLVATVVTALTSAVLVALPAAPASAHGGLTYPQTRTYACYLDGLAGGEAAGQGGNVLPTNPLCKTALATSNYPFYNWFGNLLGTIAGRHSTIADGKLCGPDPKFNDFNTPSTAWPATPVVSGSTIAIQYSAVVPHPGKFMQYITEDGWDQTQGAGLVGPRARPVRHGREPAHPPGRPGRPGVLLERKAAHQDRPAHHLQHLGALGQRGVVLQLRGRRLRRRHRRPRRRPRPARRPRPRRPPRRARRRHDRTRRRRGSRRSSRRRARRRSSPGPRPRTPAG